MKITKTEIKTASMEKTQSQLTTEDLLDSDWKSMNSTNRKKLFTSSKSPEQKKPRKNRKFLLTTMAEAASAGDIGLFGWTNVSEPIGIFERRLKL